MTISKAGSRTLFALAVLLACTVARAGDITAYTALEEDDAKVYLDAFAKAKPGIKVNILRLSTGDLIARILAEKSNPRHDVIWGVALTQMVDPRILEMAEPYRPPGVDQMKPQFRDADGRWFATTGYYAGFCVNTEILKKNNLPMPTS
ncbi:MAG: extracellular solute-binding protein, partial [Betaproteobacteria bacterium]